MTTQDTSPAAEAAPAGGCPVMHEAPAVMGSLANQHWWPEQLNLRPLNKNAAQIDPMGEASTTRPSSTASTSPRSRPTSPMC